jgi:DNA-binding protein H-NS
MTRIEVPGTFVFSQDGKSAFEFADKQIDFDQIATVDQLRAVLVAIAQCSTQAAIEAIVKHPPGVRQRASGQAEAGNQGRNPANAFQKAKEQMESALASSERSFREHQRKTAESLKQAEKDYEAATSNAINPTETAN